MERFKEHKSSMDKRNTKSALSEHISLNHANIPNLYISNFQLRVLQICRSPLQATIREAQLIEKLKPKINRKHENMVL